MQAHQATTIGVQLTQTKQDHQDAALARHGLTGVTVDGLDRVPGHEIAAKAKGTVQDGQPLNSPNGKGKRACTSCGKTKIFPWHEHKIPGSDQDCLVQVPRTFSAQRSNFLVALSHAPSPLNSTIGPNAIFFHGNVDAAAKNRRAVTIGHASEVALSGL